MFQVPLVFTGSSRLRAGAHAGTGDTLYFMPGRHIFKKGFWLMDNLKIKGAGRDSTFLSLAGSTKKSDYLFRMTKNRYAISDFTYESKKDRLLYIKPGSQLKIDRIRIINTPQMVLNLGKKSTTVVRNSVFINAFALIRI